MKYYNERDPVNQYFPSSFHKKIIYLSNLTLLVIYK